MAARLCSTQPPPEGELITIGKILVNMAAGWQTQRLVEWLYSALQSYIVKAEGKHHVTAMISHTGRSCRADCQVPSLQWRSSGPDGLLCGQLCGAGLWHKPPGPC